MRCNSFFVTGSDTNVGKTFVSCALLRSAKQRGLRCAGIKPIAAGCRVNNGVLHNDDALALITASSTSLDYETVNPIALEPPIAPHIAAAQVGRELCADDLTAHCRTVTDRDIDFVLIEGAGGWLVPINHTETLADVCVKLHASVILVVGMKLGCLNHALLTAAAIEHAGLKLAGWIANSATKVEFDLDENVATLRTWLQAPCLGVVPHLVSAGPSSAQSFLDIDPLFL